MDSKELESLKEDLSEKLEKASNIMTSQIIVTTTNMESAMGILNGVMQSLFAKLEQTNKRLAEVEKELADLKKSSGEESK
ncbi:MAG: hypothetical protein QXL94_01755 [Candidatus Parvarchaeum sp.]